MREALSYMLEGQNVSDEGSENFRIQNPDFCIKFWRQLQEILKNFLARTISYSGKESEDALKLTELYRKSLKFTDKTRLSALHDMYASWTS